jgi:hypothetical protein
VQPVDAAFAAGAPSAGSAIAASANRITRSFETCLLTNGECG